MSSSVNKVILIGFLGRDVEVHYTKTKQCIANINLATNSKWKDKITGEYIESTEWHRLVLFNKLAEIARDFLIKGSNIYIEGSLRTNKWEDKLQITRYTTEIIVKTLTMLGSNKKKNGSNDMLFANSNTSSVEANEVKHKEGDLRKMFVKAGAIKENNEKFDDDLPF